MTRLTTTSIAPARAWLGSAWTTKLARLTILLLLADGCSDEEHKGDVSHGPTATPSASAVKREQMRLTYDPGNIVAASGVAKRFRQRLKGAGIEGEIELGGVVVQVHLPPPAVAAAKEAFAGGRLDLWLAADEDPFASLKETPFAVVSDQGRHHLEAAASQGDELARHAAEHAGGAKVLLAPVPGKERLRTWLVHPDRRVRGQSLAKAEAKPHARGAALELTFSARGLSFVRWNSKQRERFILQANGAVVASAEPPEEVKDGALTFVLESWDLKAAKALAASLDGRAVSHEVTLEEEEPLPR